MSKPVRPDPQTRASTSEAKVKAAAISVASNLALTAGKLAAAWATHSVSILSEALHSGLDLIASFLALFAVRRSREAADSDHQFGHGKFESISGLIEGLLIFVVVGLILWRSIARMVSGEMEIHGTFLGIVVMAVAAVANFFVSTILFRVARRTDSVALEADAWHLRTDVWTSAGVGAGLAAMALGKRLGFSAALYLDPLLAMAIAAVILRAAWNIVQQSWGHLVDRSLPEEELEMIRALLQEHYPHYAEYHRLRTRKAGPQRYIDLHLVVPGSQTVAEAHALCDHLEKDLTDLLPRCEVMIHVEPEDDHE